MSKTGKIVFLIYFIAFIMPILLSIMDDFNISFENLNPNDYARITDVEYKAVVVDEKDSNGKVNITEKHPNKKYFPEWMINTVKPTLELKGDKYTIYVNGEKVDYGTLNIPSKDDNGRVLVVNESGKLF